MATIPFKNPWGAQNSGVDQQRADLFYVTFQFPLLLPGIGGSNLWDQECGFALEAFPFPDRARQMIPTKWLQQTNFQLGADEPSGPIEMRIRYAFNRRAHELMEAWHWLTSNPATGGVATTSAVKTNGLFQWLIPDMDQVARVSDQSDARVFKTAASYRLEGCLLRNFKPGDANMTTGNEGVALIASIQVDRYYPVRIADLNPKNFAAANSRGIFPSGIATTTAAVG